jgi:hypothetical protein
MISLAVSALLSYTFIQCWGRKVTSFVVVAFNMSFLTCLHLKRLLFNYGEWGLGIETLYMMSICKFSSICFAYEDGAKEDSEIKNSYHKA